MFSEINYNRAVVFKNALTLFVNFILFMYFRVDNGVKSGDITMTYMSIYQDVLAATDYVHTKTVCICLHIQGVFLALLFSQSIKLSDTSSD